MDNETFMINHKNENIYISGLPDRFSKFFKIKREVEKIEDYLKKSPSIFISHQPKDPNNSIRFKIESPKWL